MRITNYFLIIFLNASYANIDNKKSEEKKEKHVTREIIMLQQVQI